MSAAATALVCGLARGRSGLVLGPVLVTAVGGGCATGSLQAAASLLSASQVIVLLVSNLGLVPLRVRRAWPVRDERPRMDEGRDPGRLRRPRTHKRGRLCAHGSRARGVRASRVRPLRIRRRAPAACDSGAPSVQ